MRGVKDWFVEPVVARLPAAVAPLALTVASTVTGIGAGVAAGFGWWWWALVLWFVGRVFDGLDGPLARRRGTTSDLGGYLDLMGDTAGYIAVPLGIAFGVDTPDVWVALGVLFASLFLNAMSWTLLSAIAEKRNASTAGRRTSFEMPTGLIEGTETIVLYAAMLVFHRHAEVLFFAMAALVFVTALARVVWAGRALR